MAFLIKRSSTDDEEKKKVEEEDSSTPAYYDKPTNPNSPGYQEFIARGGASYGDETPASVASNMTRRSFGYLSTLDAQNQNATKPAGGGDGGIDTSLLPRTTTQNQTSTTTYKGQAPTNTPVFKAPEEWTASRRASEIQSQSALGLKQNRQALREAIAGLGNDPASRLALRDALNSHGINVERTLLGAKTATQQEETRDINQKMAVAQAEYTSAVNAFEAEWRKYLSTATTTSTATSTSEVGEDEEETTKRTLSRSL